MTGEIRIREYRNTVERLTRHGWVPARLCPGGPEWECGAPAAPGDRYCETCRDAIGRL